MSLQAYTWQMIFAFGFLHGVKFYADSWPVKMGPTAAPETSSANSPRIPCKNPKTKHQYSFHGESLKLRNDLLLFVVQFIELNTV
jgi:hypothetical protein